MKRLPIRARLTAAFAAAMVVVLTGAALFVYLRLRADLDETIDEGLQARVTSIAAQAQQPGAKADDGLEEEDGFAVVISRRGAAILGDVRGGLSRQEFERAARGPLVLERHVEGVEGTTRILARPATITGGAEAIAVAGRSLEDRDETLSGLLASFAIGGPLAVLLASLAGYGLATIGLAPVEAMRVRAREISLERAGDSLPLPDAHDEVRRLGETLNEMLDRLRASFERERRFVADASHELRTPIAVVKTELETALRSGDVGPAAREPLVAAVEECDRLVQLADDLLVIARSAGGELPVRAEELPAREMLEAARLRFADRAEARGRLVRVEAAEDLLVHADPVRLRQALGNLVDNALRHGEGEVILRAASSGGGVAIEVSDSGGGFPPQLAERAFERFSQGDDARAAGGAGLGLAIVRAVAEAHGGRAEVADQSTVRVWLPSQAPLSGRSYGG